MENAGNEFRVDEQNKIYILGGKGVGKTSFFHLLFSEKFDENIEPSEAGIVISTFKKDNKVFTIKELTDDENFSKTKILKNELEDILLIFILFSIDNKESFEYAKNLVQFIKNNLINNKELNIMLVGNKYDIGENDPDKIKVPKKEVDQYIYHIENVFYKELSCKTNYNFKTLKELIENIELNDTNEDEDDGKIPEEERKKKLMKLRIHHV